ncbi:MAG: energy transducer TonB, partial [Roseomonas sp.]|nr:energy transducer TonB [Roseomonas sp.]
APVAPPPPAPAELAEVMLPPPPAPASEPPREVAEKLPEPPKPSESPREVAKAPPERRPPQRASAAQPAPQPVRLNAALQGMESFTLEGRVAPPEALDAARNRRPAYPEASRRRGEEGVVRVELRVDPNGRVVDVRVLESSGFNALDAAALEAVRDWRFRPAQRAGLPVAASITTAVHFRLANERR